MALPFNGLRCARASEQARATMLAALGPSHNNTAHLSTITLPTSSSLSSSSSSFSSSAAASSSSALQSVVEESSSAACLASLDRPDARTPAQRNRRPPNRFSPNDYARNTQSEYASPQGIGQHKRRRKLVLGGVAPPSSSNATIIQTISTPVPPARPLPTRAEAVSSAAAATSNPQPSFRCPMVNCTRHRPGAAGWTSLRSLIQHVNTCHLVNDEVLPASFLREHNVSVCTPCKTLQTAQVCPVCNGKRRNRPPPTATVVEEQLPRLDPTIVTQDLTAMVWGVLRTHCATIKHLPKSFRSACAYELKSLGFAADTPDDLYDLFRLIIFLRAVLGPLPRHRGGYRGSAQARSTLGKRLQHWRATPLGLFCVVFCLTCFMCFLKTATAF